MRLNITQESKDIFIYLFENNSFVNTDVFNHGSIIFESGYLNNKINNIEKCPTCGAEKNLNINYNINPTKVYKKLIFKGYDPIERRSRYISMRFSDFFIIEITSNEGWVSLASLKNNPILHYISEELWNNFLAIIKENIKIKDNEYFLTESFIKILEKKIIEWHGTIEIWEREENNKKPIIKEININKRKYTKKK